MTLLERSAHATYCPYKGDCATSVSRRRERAINAVWTYEAPYARWRPSGTTWLSTQTGWTRSRSIPARPGLPKPPAGRSDTDHH